MDHYDAMNTVLVQELVRYNGLLDVVHSSLQQARNAMTGLFVMSAEMDSIFRSMCATAIPNSCRNRIETKCRAC
jgi:dynein heavy chain, axonemal